MLALSLMTSAGYLWMLYLEYARGKDTEDPESLHLFCDHHQVISKWGVIFKKPVSFDSVPKFQGKDVLSDQ